MKSLYELARLTNRQNKAFDLLIPFSEDSPLRKLYNLVAAESHLDDSFCMIEIYGKKNTVAFSRLKSRLREIFFQALLIQASTSDPEQERFDEIMLAYKTTVISRILNNRRSFNLANEVLEKSLAKSVKYHLTENVLAQVRLLIIYNSTVTLNKYKIVKFLQIQEKYQFIYQWELKSENYFLDLQKSQLTSLASVSNDIVRKAFNYYKDLESAGDVRSFNFNYNKYRILAAYYEFTKNYNSLLTLSEEALKEFSSPEFKSEAVISNINIRRLWSLIQSGQFKQAYSLGTKLMSKLQIGSNAWYRVSHYTLKARIYSGDYAQSIELLTQIIENPRFNKTSEYYKELFYTSLGYMYLLVDSGLVGGSNDLKDRLPDFKLGRFLNTVPVFSKDKRGINVSILLMHIAFLLLRKDYNAIIDRVDSLNQYVYRYLRKDDSFRSNCIIKMVIQITRADFNKIRAERYTAELRRQLNEVPLIGSGENIEIEVIPFEVLWEIMYNSL